MDIARREIWLVTAFHRDKTRTAAFTTRDAANDWAKGQRAVGAVQCALRSEWLYGD